MPARQPAIDVSHASKLYRRFSHRRQFATLKSALLSRSLVRDLEPEERFTALDDVTVVVPPGRTLGVIGRNGSGKSTLLKLVAGITKPTSGSVKVKGRISALIELGAGFHPEISGRENVFINGIMLGLTKREIARRFDEIVDFAELREFIDAPVKTYSSGMYMRLGFAVAINVDPDVLLVDEVLAVGDEGFTHKCLDKFAEFRRRGKTILLVTHSLGLVEQFCDDALWLDAGRVQGHGEPKRIVGAYRMAVADSEETQIAAGDARARESAAKAVVSPDEPASAVLPDNPVETGSAPSDMFRAAEGRWGSREIEITDVALVGEAGAPAHVFQSGDPVDIRIRLHAALPADDFVFGIGIFNAEGVCVYGTNTTLDELMPARIAGDAEAVFSIPSLDLVEGTYKLDVAIHKVDGYPYDYHRLLYTFRVKSTTKDVGIYRPAHAWRFSGDVRFKPAPPPAPEAGRA
ncbi:MAG TPA: ABC transporter ATP-binding protein [Vicinamibacterales bacterium]|nr:ABC transporter ATP-binding protein [Vicinamibacterales bacterium]